jgi:hypothetical protein
MHDRGGTSAATIHVYGGGKGNGDMRSFAIYVPIMAEPPEEVRLRVGGVMRILQRMDCWVAYWSSQGAVPYRYVGCVPEPEGEGREP